MKIGFMAPETSAVNDSSNKPRDLSGIRFTDGKGNTVDLGNLKGKVIFLNFCFWKMERKDVLQKSVIKEHPMNIFNL